ncbi:MAG: hypothetical protein AB7T49_11230 [Oligoflexales bacterium]
MKFLKKRMFFLLGPLFIASISLQCNPEKYEHSKDPDVAPTEVVPPSSSNNPDTPDDKPTPPLPQTPNTGAPQETSNSEIWNSDTLFAQGGALQEETAFGPDKVLYPSHAGENRSFKFENGYLTWTGNRTRIYLDHYQKKTLVNSELEFYAEKNADVIDISTKIGNHSREGYEFGGYGCEFHDVTVESKVEYFHNDQGKEVKATIDPMLPGKWIGYKVTKQNVAGAAEVVMNCYVDYTGNGDWQLVLKDRRWSQVGWKPGETVPEASDSEEITRGPYLSAVGRWWIRIDGGTHGGIKVRNIRIRELTESPE